jgi:hypothetical protein
MGLIDKRGPGSTVNADAYLAYSYLLKGFMMYSDFAARAITNLGTVAINKAGYRTENFICEGFGTATAADTDKVANIGVGNDATISGPLTPLVSAWDGSKKTTGQFLDLSNLNTVNYRGTFFPYFPTMNTPDKSVVIHIFPQLFMRALGDTAQAATILWSRLRRGIKSLATSTAGRSLSHLYTGIHLSMQSGLPIICVLNKGIYVGFILVGSAEFVLWSKTYVSVSPTDLITHLGELNRQDRLLGEIVVLINSVVNDSGMPIYSFTKSDIETSRKLIRVFNSIKQDLYVATTLNEIATKSEELVFGSKFATRTPAALKDFLMYLQTGMDSHIDKYPGYLGGKYLLKTSRLAIGLGIFGPDAPTCSYGVPGNSQTFTLPGPDATIDPNLHVENNVRSLRYLTFSIVPIRQAESQWSSMLNSGRMYIPFGRKNKAEFTNSNQSTIKVAASPMFDDMYRIIRDVSQTYRAGRKEGKRKNRDDDKESGPSNDRKRTKKESVAAGDMI